MEERNREKHVVSTGLIMALHFTAPETWKGGFFELFVQPRTNTSDELCSLLKVLWSFPSLDGCYADRDCEPSSQTRVLPCANNVDGYLYGLATLPNGKMMACVSYASHGIGAEGMAPSYRVGFYLPLGALSTAYSVGIPVRVNRQRHRMDTPSGGLPG